MYLKSVIKLNTTNKLGVIITTDMFDKEEQLLTLFFATAYGKQLWSETDGTVNQLVSNSSLKCINNSQILNPHDMFQYWKNNI